MDYSAAFKNIRTNGKYGVESPHKALLLLTIIEMYEKNILEENEIRYDESLLQTFLEVWSRALPNESLFHPTAYLPFWYLQSEGFWHIVPVRGKEDILESMRIEHLKPTEAKVRDCIKYAQFDENLYFLMTLPTGRASLKRILLDNYTSLSESEKESWCTPVDNSVDTSVVAVQEFINLMKPAGDVSSYQSNLEDEVEMSSLADDLQIALNYQYFLYLYKHRFDRSVIRKYFPSPSILYKTIVRRSLADEDLHHSEIGVLAGFLSDVKVALMNENGGEDLIDDINYGIKVLNDKESLSEKNRLSDDELFGEIDDPDPINSTKQEITLETKKEEKQSDAVQQSIEPYHPVDFFVECDEKKSTIYSLDGDELTKIDGQLKVIRGQLYRFNFKPMCLTVKTVNRTQLGWIKGGKVLVPYSDSALYRRLDPSCFLDDIEDIISTEKLSDNRIKVLGKWYDFDGAEDENYVPTTIYSSNISSDASSTDSHGVYAMPLISKEKLAGIKKVSTSPYDYLWTIAIVSLLNENERILLTYDEIACMMIANAWELFFEFPVLKEKDELLSACVDFLIEESHEYMDEPLSIDSSVETIFNAIKDYPMSGPFEDAVDELVKTSPYSTLKAWLNHVDEREIVMHSVNYAQSCLYALHQKKYEPCISVNPEWKRFLLSEKSSIRLQFIEYYLNYYGL